VLLVAVLFVIVRKVRSAYKGNAYQRLEEGEGGAVGDASFSKKFEQVAPHELKIGPRIGKGSFAEVFKARWRGTLVAIKKLPAHSLTPEFFEDFEREADLMKRLRHPNVLLYLGTRTIHCARPPCSVVPDLVPQVRAGYRPTSAS
jgi:serine/threonine protein kinase